MHLFVAFFEEDIPQHIKETAEQTFPVYAVSDRILLLRTPISDPQAISTFFRMDEGNQEPIVGMVLKLNGSRAGYFYKSAWDWFKESGDPFSG